MQRSAGQHDHIAGLPSTQSCQSSRGRPPSPRRRHRAAPRSTDRLEPAVRGAWAQSRIAETPVSSRRIQDPARSRRTSLRPSGERNFLMQRKTRKTAPFCLPQILLETRRASQSLPSSAKNAAILARTPTQRLGGGVRSQIRTGLSPDKWPFAANICEIVPVIEKCTRIRCVDLMACRQLP